MNLPTLLYIMIGVLLLSFLFNQMASIDQTFTKNAVAMIIVIRQR